MLGNEENPTRIHGRLLEAVDISGYSNQRAVAAFEWLIDNDRWRDVSPGFKDINVFLETVDMSPYRIGKVVRERIIEKLHTRDAANTRTAQALGVNEKTVRNDLRPDASEKSEGDLYAGASGLPLFIDTSEDSEDDHAVASDGGRVRAAGSAPAEDDEDEGMPAGAGFVAADGSVWENECGLCHAQWNGPGRCPDCGGSSDRAAELYDAEPEPEAPHIEVNEGDEWYTPRWLFDALGVQFSLDVCAPVDQTYSAVPADRCSTVEDDGLAQPWHGTVWCNPPYSSPEPWARRMIHHRDGLLLTHVPMNAAWCVDTWEACDAIRLFQAMEFVRPDGSSQRPGYWLQLAAFGEAATAALARLQPLGSAAANRRRVASPMWRPAA
jgi:hypothetical protein